MGSVVGAAIVREARVLAARRTTPPETAGRWELPGGKVESGERPDDAVVREVAEELGCEVEVTGWLAASAPVGTAHVLRVATARLVRGEPTPHEHDAVRWLGPEQLDEVDWLTPDRPFLPELATLLRRAARTSGGSPGEAAVRGIFFDEDDAAAVADRLERAGYAVRLARERLAGEDDDEDHPWAVLTDAPATVLELLVEEFDGWLDHGDPDPVPPRPLDLPAAPRRVTRHD